MTTAQLAEIWLSWLVISFIMMVIGLLAVMFSRSTINFLKVSFAAFISSLIAPLGYFIFYLIEHAP